MTGKKIRPHDEIVLCSEAVNYVRKTGAHVFNRHEQMAEYLRSIGYLVSRFRLVFLFSFLFMLLVPSVLAVDPLLEFDLDNRTNLTMFFLFLAFAFALMFWRLFTFAGAIFLILGVLYVVNGGSFILGTIILGGALVILYYGIYK